MKIGQRTGLTNTYRDAGQSVPGAWVVRWHREINSNLYRFTYIKWDDDTAGILSRQVDNPSAIHYFENEDAA